MVFLAVGGTVLHFWDADQELAVVSQDHHGQLSPGLLHQVLGLQKGQVLCGHPIDLENEVSLLQSALLGSQTRLSHVFDEDLASQLQSIL